jgi:4-amino-4-deoxy-L-arabinose transferase-like glycosyltransferase
VPRVHLALAVALLLALLGVLHFWGLGAQPLYSVGEPREATEVVEEFDNGTWILPLRNGGNLPSKPPLYHWLGGLTAVAVGRVDEWVVRFPSALVATLTVLAVAWFGARRWDASAGIAAACILATNFEWLKSARAARVDMTLTGCMTAAFLALAVIIEAPSPPRLALLAFYLAMGLGTLTKGPVGIALPVAAALLYLAVRRDIGRLRQMQVVRGMALTLGLPALWYLLASIVGGMPFVRKQILRENVLHFLGPGNYGVNLSHPIWYYAKALAGGMAPWSVFLIPLAVYLWQQRRRREVIEPYLFPLLWFAVVMGFYTVAASKRSNYILAAYPAVALMLGAWWSTLWQSTAALSPRARRIVQVIAGIAAVATASVVVVLLLHAVGLDPLGWIRPLLHRKDQQNLPIVRELLHSHSLVVVLWVLSSVIATALLVIGARRERWALVFVAIVLYVTATATAIDRTLTLRIAQLRTYKPFAAEVTRLAGSSQRLFFYDTFDFGLVFYARRMIVVVEGEVPAAPAWLIMSEERYARFSDDERAAMPVLARSDGTGPEGNERYVLVRRAGDNESF